eukprot:6212877-Pleurochrysis_carterae.AAC.4
MRMRGDKTSQGMAWRNVCHHESGTEESCEVYVTRAKCMSPVFNTPPCDDAGEKRSICLWHEKGSDCASGLAANANLHTRWQRHLFRVAFEVSVQSASISFPPPYYWHGVDGNDIFFALRLKISVCSECEHKLLPAPVLLAWGHRSAWWLWSLSAGSGQLWVRGNTRMQVCAQQTRE